MQQKFPHHGKGQRLSNTTIRNLEEETAKQQLEDERSRKPPLVTPEEVLRWNKLADYYSHYQRHFYPHLSRLLDREHDLAMRSPTEHRISLVQDALERELALKHGNSFFPKRYMDRVHLKQLDPTILGWTHREHPLWEPKALILLAADGFYLPGKVKGVVLVATPLPLSSLGSTDVETRALTTEETSQIVKAVRQLDALACNSVSAMVDTMFPLLVQNGSFFGHDLPPQGFSDKHHQLPSTHYYSFAWDHAVESEAAFKLWLQQTQQELSRHPGSQTSQFVLSGDFQFWNHSRKSSFLAFPGLLHLSFNMLHGIVQ